MGARAQAPKPAFTDPNAPPFIARFERVESDKRVCAIVRADGFFHTEIETSGGFEAGEGAIDQAELSRLRTALNNGGLSALTQKQIPIPLFVPEKDEFLVSILRVSKTQNLTFVDRESRKPYQSLVEPLLQWLEQLRRHPHTLIGEFEGRTQCLPPHDLKFSSRQPVAATSQAPPNGPATTNGPNSDPAPRDQAIPPKSPFLMRWQTERIVSGIDSICVIVYPSGNYHMEKMSQSPHEKVKTRVFDGGLDSPSVQELQMLLDEPGLRASTFQHSAGGDFFREGEITNVSVYRDGHIQRLSFADLFAIPGSVTSRTDPEEKVVAPLRKWIKIHIEAKKSPASQQAIPTRCAPLPQEK